METKILLTEDNAFFREGLCELLTKEGYIVTAAQNAKTARMYIALSEFDLCILDVLLPDGNGLDICREIRNSGKDTRILFLTACDDESEIVSGLDSGADDYVTKPFGVKILLSRIRALLRRRPVTSYETGGLSVGFSSMNVKLGGENVFLTPTEFSALIKTPVLWSRETVFFLQFGTVTAIQSLTI